MLLSYKLISAGSAALFLGLGAANIDDRAHQYNSDPGDPVHCEILTSQSRGMTTLEGRLYTDTKINGSYRFKVVSEGRSGNSSVQQGGEFHVDPGEPAILGKVMLNSRGITFDATLKIQIDGKTIECAVSPGMTI